MTDPKPSPEVYAIDFATLAREIAQDIFEIPEIIRLHQLTDDEWAKIQQHPRFLMMLAQMQREWNSAANTRERIRVKAQTGLESQLEIYVRDIGNPDLPLTQRVEAGRFLARLGELDGEGKLKGGDGGAFHITLNIGQMPQISLDAKPVIDITPGAIPDQP